MDHHHSVNCINPQVIDELACALARIQWSELQFLIPGSQPLESEHYGKSQRREAFDMARRMIALALTDASADQIVLVVYIHAELSRRCPAMLEPLSAKPPVMNQSVDDMIEKLVAGLTKKPGPTN